MNEKMMGILILPIEIFRLKKKYPKGDKLRITPFPKNQGKTRYRLVIIGQC
jgi:hypothetical protein